MMLWDGLNSAKHCQVVVMGATNRPQDVDKAILRRMPAMFQIGLPSKLKRKDILTLILENETLNDDVDLGFVADMSEGFSGSDLRELCRGAAMFRVRELSYLLHNSFQGSRYSDLREITMSDFTSAIIKMKESKVQIAGRLMLPFETEALD